MGRTTCNDGLHGRGKPQPRWQWLLTRSLAGLAFGFICNGVVQVCWIVLLIALFGSLDVALKEMRFSIRMVVGFAAYLASMPASFLGGLIAPFALGTGTPRRGALLSSSIYGAALAAFQAAVLGGSIALVTWQFAPRSMVFVSISLGLGVPVGIAGGWLGGYIAKRGERGNVLHDETS